MLIQLALGLLMLFSAVPGDGTEPWTPSGTASMDSTQDRGTIESALSLLRSIPNWDSQPPNLDAVQYRPTHIPKGTPSLLEWRPLRVSRAREDATDKLITLSHMDTRILYDASVLYMEQGTDLHHLLTVLALVRLVFDLTAVDQSAFPFATDYRDPEGHLFPWTVGPGGVYLLTGIPPETMHTVYPLPDPLTMFRDFIKQGVPRRAYPVSKKPDSGLEAYRRVAGCWSIHTHELEEIARLLEKSGIESLSIENRGRVALFVKGESKLKALRKIDKWKQRRRGLEHVDVFRNDEVDTGWNPSTKEIPFSQDSVYWNLSVPVETCATRSRGRLNSCPSVQIRDSFLSPPRRDLAPGVAQGGGAVEHQMAFP